MLLASEPGTNVALSPDMVIQAANGTFDSSGDEVRNITKWANNITINGDESVKLQKLVDQGTRCVRWGAVLPDQPDVSVGCDNLSGGREVTAVHGVQGHLSQQDRKLAQRAGLPGELNMPRGQLPAPVVPQSEVRFPGQPAPAE